jgi:glycosyltransferase involved in cell wall biosynthesis
VKVGLYGGMANNMYVFAKELARAGVDVVYIRDRSDSYIMSQPSWEDIEWEVSQDTAKASSAWTLEEWHRREIELRWTAPNWLVDPAGDAITASPTIGQQKSILRAGNWLNRYCSLPSRSFILRELKSCDTLMVCGVEGSLLALESKVPYIIWPHGGDMMIASKEIKLARSGIRATASSMLFLRNLRESYRRALAIGSHEPGGVQSDEYGSTGAYGRTLNVQYLPIPMSLAPRKSHGFDFGVGSRAIIGGLRGNFSDRQHLFKRMLMERGYLVCNDTRYIFVPSRIDYRWKGHDKLLEAVSQTAALLRSGDFRVVFTGWGLQHQDFVERVRSAGIDDLICFLGTVYSKPLLRRLFSCADLVVDQFEMGMCGTASLEAMAAGAPLLMYLSNGYQRPFGPAPVLNARTAEEIASVLRAVATDQIDLNEVAERQLQWINCAHSIEATMRSMKSIFVGKAFS